MARSDPSALRTPGVSGRATISQCSERDFQVAVIELFQWHSWLVMHPFDSRRTAPGYPDLTCAHRERGLFIGELKSETGRLRVEQQAWLDTLVLGMGAGSKHRGASWWAREGRTAVGLFRPSAWDWLEKIAKGEKP